MAPACGLYRGPAHRLGRRQSWYAHSPPTHRWPSQSHSASVWWTGIVGSVVSVHVCALAFAGLKIVPSLELQFATFVVLSVYRALFYTAMIALLIEMYAHNHHHPSD